MKPKALIVEDNYNTATAFTEALEQAGYEVETINDGISALELIATNSYYIVILDFHLPLINGYELLKKIRASEHLADTKVILVTADARMAKKIEASADLVLVKPIGFTQLRDITRQFLPSN